MQSLLILLRWQLRQLFWINCLAVCGILWFALLFNSAITFFRGSPVLPGVMVHCGLMVLWLGRSEPRGPGFLYSQGFSRDQIWWSTFLATLCSGILVTGCLWLTIVTGLRSLVQASLGNPWFPMAGTIESTSSLWFLVEYCLLLPPMHYVWVRARLPQRDAGAGWALALGIIAIDANCYSYASQVGQGAVALLLGAATVLALLTLIAGWKFHRQIEVQS